MKLRFFQLEPTDVFVTDHHGKFPLVPLGYHQRKRILVILFSAVDLIYFTTPVCPFINLSLMSILLISITLAPVFNSNQEERFPVSASFLALKETGSSSDKVTPFGNWSIASKETIGQSNFCIMASL